MAGQGHRPDRALIWMFGEGKSNALHAALRDAFNTIAQMPAHHMTYANGAPVLPVMHAGRLRRPNSVRLDDAYLSAFGELRVPRHLWRAFQRFDVWIEPALCAEWSRLMKSYAARQGRDIDDRVITDAMMWSDPKRYVRTAKEQALRLIDDRGLHCVWSGSRLKASTLDIDHCFPWAAWPCEDLWNLVPASRPINQQKSDKLPSDAILRSAQDRIMAWWEAGYINARNSTLPQRFMTEAQASLPLSSGDPIRLDDVFSGLAIQRLRLKHDQQVPEWDGSRLRS